MRTNKTQPEDTRLSLGSSLKYEGTPPSTPRLGEVGQVPLLPLGKLVHVSVCGHLVDGVHEGLGEWLLPHLVTQLCRHAHPLVEAVNVSVQVYRRDECEYPLVLQNLLSLFISV